LPQEDDTRASRLKRRTTFVGAGALAVGWLTLSSPLAAAPALVPPGCAPHAFDSAQYTLCSFDVRHDDIRLYWSGADDKPYANFASLAAALSARGKKLRFAMNAGMFGDDFAPVGLYVENGKRLRRADTRAGPTNFHLLPNGVFWVGDGVAGVEETSRFLADAPPAKFATQSGPMLVIDGHIHPKILPTGASQKVRNGVCVRDGVTAIFAISDEPVTFHAFARLFRDELGCANALFLDGSVSSLYAPELGRDDELAPLGPMIGVSVPASPH
jgi:prepilin-type processing-associated H-X9-DG protein